MSTKGSSNKKVPKRTKKLIKGEVKLARKIAVNLKPKPSSNKRMESEVEKFLGDTGGMAPTGQPTGVVGAQVFNNALTRFPKFEMLSVRSARGMRLKGTEMLSNNFGTTDNMGVWGVNTITVNPANASTFPRMSNIAKLFDEFTFHRLRFFWFPCIAVSNTGRIIFSGSYDPYDIAPTSAATQFQQTDPSASAIYVPNEWVYRPNYSDQPAHFTTTANWSAAAAQARETFPCVVHMASDSCQAGFTLSGFVFVEYEVELWGNIAAAQTPPALTQYDQRLLAAQAGGLRSAPTPVLQMLNLMHSSSGPVTTPAPAAGEKDVVLT